MRIRPLLAAAGVVALVAGVPAHAAGAKPKTLDGKKTKVLTWTGASTAQDHDSDFVMELAGTTPDFAHCGPPECLRFPFVFKPAKGVKYGAVSTQISWTIPGEDFDLYVVDNFGIVGQCGASAGTSEVVTIDDPVPGHTYTIVAHEFRTGPDTLTATAKFPAQKFTTPVPAAAQSPAGLGVGCGLSS